MCKCMCKSVCVARECVSGFSMCLYVCERVLMRACMCIHIVLYVCMSEGVYLRRFVAVRVYV